MVSRSGKKGAAQGERPARLIDVAHRAEVSRATAARALGGYGLVGDETRERVLAAARELNYSANVVARAMRAGRTLTIGVVVADISNSFFSHATRAIIDTAAKAGYQTLVLNTDDDLAKEIDAVRVLMEKRVDGLIVVPSSSTHHDHLVQEGELAKPLVLLDRKALGLTVPVVCTDDRGGAKAAVELFLERGHTRIGLLVATAAARGGPEATLPNDAVSTVHERVAGALEAIDAHRARKPIIRYCRSTIEEARVGALELLTQKVPASAILATNEEMTFGVLAACDELGLAVGKDVSLVSFDDTPWSRAIAPAVSVIRRPVYALGHAAATALIKEIRGEGRSGEIKLPVELIDRRSVAKPVKKSR
ncbi:LacI family DNA-binding transcriptional regulator [Burkholderia cenocepacia]|uniref:LacI family DNA-binding transcriptional regulator n=1 Tax=Burkholderia cenocepacia TaxID=95486 RepID=UPI0023B91AFD|nr:LacI family DNA-binding transcriptional regulator [Burkholderia cenocepacia]MDF0504639.1 LacI family DNA-binding transcriptional regulator [Burkholderia cenocepacia]